MALEIVCGPFQPGLEEAFVARLQELKPGIDNPVAVVCPSGRIAARLQRLLGAERGLAFLGLDFHTFHSLSDLIVERSGLLDKTIVRDGLFHDRLVDRMLKNTLGSQRVQRGLASSYRSSIRDLVDAGLDTESPPEDFFDHFKDPAERKSLEGLVKTAGEYLKRLDELEILPPGGAARLAARAIEEGKAGWLTRYKEILYYGFYDLTGAQADFFEAVVKNHPARVFFPYVKDHPAYVFAKRFLDSTRMRHGGVIPSYLPLRPETRALDTTLSRLFKPGAKEPAGEPALEVFSVSGARDEIWRVAKEILLLTERSKDPVAFHEIGVVARDLGAYASEVRDVFRENRIPFTMSVGESLLEQPVVQMALRLLRLHRAQYPAKTVLDIAGSPFFRTHKDGWEERRSWRRLLTLSQLHSGWLQWEGKVAPYADKDFPIGAPGAEGRQDVIPKAHTAALWKTVSGWRRDLDPALAPRGWSKMSEHVSRLLADSFTVSGNDPASQRAVAAWDAMLEAIESLKVLELAEPDADFDDFLEAFEKKLEYAGLEPPRECLGVRVMDSMAARGEAFNTLFVLGLKQGVTPREVREDPFLSEYARKILGGHVLGLWIWEKLSSKDEEKLLFHSLLNAASHKVYCLFPRSDEQGKAQTPSTYLQQLLRAAGIRYEAAGRQYVPRRPFDKIRTALKESATLVSPKEASAWLCREGKSPKVLFSQLEDWDEGWDGDLLDACLARGKVLNARDPKWTAIDGIVDPDKDLEGRIKKNGLSPSSLDMLRACPFRYFAERVLRIDSDKEAAESGQMQSWAVGLIYHDILHHFHVKLAASGFWDKNDAEWGAELERSIGHIFGETGWRGMGVYPVVFEAMRARMSRHLESMVRLDIAELRSSGLTPILFEHELSGAAGGLKFKGRLDRVDSDGETFRVIDYKSRWRKGALRNHLKAMEQLQAPIYQELLCVDDRYKVRPELVIGARYLAIEDSKESNGRSHFIELDGVDWREGRAQILKNIKTMVGAALSGRFPITPDEGQGQACDYCPMDTLCRRRHKLSRWRAQNSPERAALDSAHTVEISSAGDKRKRLAGLVPKPAAKPKGEARG